MRCLTVGLAITALLALSLVQVPWETGVPEKEGPIYSDRIRCDGDCLGTVDQVTEPTDGSLMLQTIESMGASSRATNQYAVLVGINDYPGSGNDLFQCIADVNKIKNKLTGDYGWSSSNIKVLTDSQATHAAVTNALDWLAEQDDEGSQVWFSFSGHGTTETQVLYDTGLSDNTIATKFNAMDAKEKVILLDSCFSGSNYALQNLENTIVLTGCSASQYSYDGMFTPAIVNEMDDNVALEDAFKAADTTVNSQTGGSQNPVMWDNIDGDLFLDDRPPEIIGTVPDQSEDEDVPIVIDLTGFEHDQRDSGTDLDWSVQVYDDNYINDITGENSDDDVLTFISKEDWYGDTMVTLKLTDSNDKSITQQVKLTWTPVNDAPTVTEIQPASKNVFRTSPIKVVIQGKDPEEGNGGLTIEVEYKSPTGSWTKWTGVAKNGNVWQGDFFTEYNAEIGSYSMRARIRDSVGSWGDWTTVSNVFMVLNNLPIVETMTYSSFSVERGDNLTVVIDGKDIESPDDYLTCEVEFIEPEGMWTPVPDMVQYDSIEGIWGIIFKPMSSAELGNYGFRVRLSDDEGGIGTWVYQNGSVEVMNSRPRVTGIVTPDPAIVYRANQTELYIIASDLEEPDANLMCEVNYRPNGTGDYDWTIFEGAVVLDWDRWAFLLEMVMDAETGPYDMRARCIDSFGEYGGWSEFYSIVNVTNNPPTVTVFSPDAMSVYRGEILSFDASGVDVEDGTPQLTIEMEYRHQDDDNDEGAWSSGGIDVEWDPVTAQWTIGFEPDPGMKTGSYDFRVRLIDTEMGLGPWSELHDVNVRNNPPDPAMSYPDPVNVGVEARFDASGTTDLDSSNMEYRWDFGDGSNGVGVLVAHTYDKFGPVTVKLTAEDDEGAETVLERVVLINALPDIKVTSSQGAGTYDVLFTTSGDDPDGKVVEYLWDFDVKVDSDKDGDPANDVDSSTKSPTNAYSGPGTYKYRLVVVDDRGGRTVVERSVEVSAFSFGVGTSSFVPMMAGLLLLFIIVIVVALLLLRRRRKGSARTEPRQPPQEPEAMPAPEDGYSTYGESEPDQFYAVPGEDEEGRRPGPRPW